MSVYLTKRYHKTRICCICNKVLTYSCSDSYNLSVKNETICVSCANLKKQSNKESKLEKLVNGSNESMYWVGFILADGHISNIYRLAITLANKDTEHLRKFSNYVNTPLKTNKHKQAVVAVMDKNNIKKLVDMFDINSDKTYSPPKAEVLLQFNKEQLLSLLVGFIDGDGSIRNLHNRPDFSLRIKCHKAWEYFLTSLFFILEINISIKINNQGYLEIVTGNSILLKRIKREVLALRVPFMERKWDIINFEFVSKQEFAEIKRCIVKTEVKIGTADEDIAKILGITNMGLYHLKRTIKIEKL